MIWFKNAIIYEFGQNYTFDLKTLQEALKTCLFEPCSASSISSFGWVSPLSDQSESDNHLFIESNGHVLLKVKREVKVVPTAVIKTHVQDAIEAKELTLARKLTKTEKVAIKEAVIIELLPRAFSKYSHYYLWIDTNKKRIVIDVGSFKLAEDLLSLLRKSLGRLPVLPFTSQVPMEKIMTKWLTHRESLKGFLLGDEVELIDPLDESSSIKFKKCDAESDEVLMHINTGRQSSKIKLVLSDQFSFILSKDVTLKRIKFEQDILEQHNDFLPEERDQLLKANFLLMADSLQKGINKLQELIIKNNKN